jgi:hypothetical protein
MTGLIWLVQLVHYPLLSQVGRDQFVAYEAAHTSQISRIVVPVMLFELLTAVALVVVPPPPFERLAPAVALGLLVLVWATTAVYSVPSHGILSTGFDAEAHRSLVGTNWLRTAAWSLRVGLLGWLVFLSMRS